jgi:hypothetical protein
MKSSKLHKMQLGRRAAYLRRCILCVELLERYEDDTTVRYRIFEKYIKPELHCSYATFNNMLNEANPQKQLETIELKLQTI